MFRITHSQIRIHKSYSNLINKRFYMRIKFFSGRAFLKIAQASKNFYKHIILLIKQILMLIIQNVILIGSLTITACISIAATAFSFEINIDDLGNWGDFIGGIFSSIALVWLVAGYVQQNKSINRQYQIMGRNNLTLERQAFIAIYEHVLPALYEEALIITDNLAKNKYIINPPYLPRYYTKEAAQTLFVYLDEYENLRDSLALAISSPGSSVIVASINGFCTTVAAIDEICEGGGNASLIASPRTLYRRIRRISRVMEVALLTEDLQRVSPNFL